MCGIGRRVVHYELFFPALDAKKKIKKKNNETPQDKMKRVKMNTLLAILNHQIRRFFFSLVHFFSVIQLRKRNIHHVFPPIKTIPLPAFQINCCAHSLHSQNREIGTLSSSTTNHFLPLILFSLRKQFFSSLSLSFI